MIIMSRIYKDFFDISYMVEEAEQKHICFVIAVSEDKDRGCGKTYSMSKLLYNKFVNNGDRFMLFVRNVKQMGKVADGIFSKFLIQEHPDTVIQEVVQNKGGYSEIYLITKNGEEQSKELFGYTACLKNATDIKLFSSIFSAMNVRRFYMDEFMPLDGKYLPNETDLMKTIYDSVNRDIEDLPIILTANTISLGNPYFTMLKLNNKLQSNTKSLKTDTCIYENVEVEGLAAKHINSAANKAFGKTGDDYTSNVWIGDNNSLVMKPDGLGRGIYIFTLVCNNQRYGVLEYPGAGIIYVNRKPDKNCPYIYNLTLEGDLSIQLMKCNNTMKNFRDRFFKGQVRVSDGTIQRMLLEILG